VLGPEHNDTLSAQHEHARWLNVSGEHAAAKKLFASVVVARLELLGPGHPDTLLSQEGLAFAHKGLGEQDAAKALFDEIRAHRTRVLDADSPDLLFALLYETTERLDDDDPDALNELEQRFEDLLRAVGAGHRYVHLAAQAVAFYRGRAGRSGDPMVALIEGMLKVLPADDPLRGHYTEILRGQRTR
jgi:hypothetical protein